MKLTPALEGHGNRDEVGMFGDGVYAAVAEGERERGGTIAGILTENHSEHCAALEVLHISLMSSSP